jgi:hypothetical protein
MVIRRVLAFLLLSAVKIASHVFYKSEINYFSQDGEKHFADARIFVFLNHTSLYEPLFLCALPFSFLWKIAGHNRSPGANITLSRPIVGLFWKILLPKITSITRKRDDTWRFFLESIRESDLIMIAPEGCMKRPNGLDKYGNKMIIRGGVAEILDKIHDGYMILALSGGLHHIQIPGQVIPKLFKKISMKIEFIDIKKYKKKFSTKSVEIRKLIVEDLQRRLESDCPEVVV